MDSLKKMCVAIVLCAATLFQVDVYAKQAISTSSAPTKALVDAEAEEVIDEEAAKLNQMTQETQDIIDGANEVIRTTGDKFRRGEISRVRSATIVGEQNYIIKQAKKQLEQARQDAIDKVKEISAQAGYSLGGLVSGIKSWYYGPEEMRSAAESALNELQKGFKDAQAEYAVKMQATDPQAAERYSNEWSTIKQDFENEINKQKRIVSGGMSTGFWTAVVGAAAVVGGAVAYKYLNSWPKNYSWGPEQGSKNRVDESKEQEKLEEKSLLPQASIPKPKKMGEWERLAKAQQEERDLQTQRRQAANQPPVAEPVVITLESAREAYDHAKKRADAAEAKLTKAQKEFDDNAAEIARLSAAGARGKNAVKIRDLERRQAGRLSKALTNAETTFGSAENSLISASRKLADVSE